jgi:hypothetical protein
MWPRRGPELVATSSSYEQHTAAGAVIGALWPVVLGCAIAAMASIIVRWRRAVGIERQQLKWLMLAAAVSGPAIVVTELLPEHSLAYGVAQVANSPAWLAIAAALAVLRYRLYDIDRIVSRTASYAIVTGLIAGVYVGGVSLTVGVLRLSSTLGVAAATLVAAAVFQPLRRRIQQSVDRRFNRASYDARRVVEAFSARLRDEVDGDAVHADLITTVELVVAPATASVWVPAR